MPDERRSFEREFCEGWRLVETLTESFPAVGYGRS